MSEIVRGRTTITDVMNKIHEEKDGVTCCGRKISMLGHIDGVDYYEYSFQCKCGNVIIKHTIREKEQK